ncbi:ArsR/SmtB family transcription factor [Streptomyces sp. GDS52]|uniref:Winged helix-turn-helix domain-containing protein n=1 Tax=Streptomyces cathayae TaxID=3031124 RepID=A0ABY8KC64_9ACTN|nr:winged helix-turn-helix domain-containing protein [Streptomyces sp. HUAS 5]WGD44406.1 winged helix-turn-helix domain-containing protein [Streptomyces sp. HUAS 5]
MLRVHFTTEDLLRTKVAPGPDPLWEAVLSANLLGNRDGQAVFDPWRARTRARLRHLAPGHAQLIRCLAPPRSDFPDFLTPPEGMHGPEVGVDAVLATPAQRLRAELAVLPALPAWIRPLAEGDLAAVTNLGHALLGYHRVAIAPYWPRIRALVEADRAVRARSLLDGGADGLLHSMRPTLRWNSPVLEADYPVERDVHLDGRGLLLIPSVFCWRTPVALIDPTLDPTLVYPVSRGAGWWTVARTGQAADRALARVLGPGRALTLRMVEEGCTTGELARRTGLAAPTASRNATALREAGLIASLRTANTVTHVLTPLGAALLSADSSYGPGCHLSPAGPSADPAGQGCW